MKTSSLSRLVALVLVLFLATSGFSNLDLLPVASWVGKIDSRLIAQAKFAGTEGERVEFLITLREQADLSGAAALKTKLEKVQYVYQKLVETAHRTQPAVVKVLAARGLEYRPYWIANLIWARGDWASIQVLAQRSDIARLDPNPQVRMSLPAPTPASRGIQSVASIEWNLLLVKADQVWSLGDRGQGVVIGGQDTGYQWDHPALINQYRGWDGSSADHNYNWHDAIHANQGDNRCGANLLEPCDDYNHGTHTMGIMVGDDGEGNQIGMAPEAKWIGCRNMDNGVGTPESYTECFQWFLAPTDLNDQNPKPSKAPDVINNSWSCIPSEGCVFDTLQPIVDAVRTAGIVVVVSAGNSGPDCSSVNNPPGVYDSSFTVANTNRYDQIYLSSSRGPVTVDGSQRLKPDLSAPGTGIRSSIPTNQYGYLTGTSMAAPHVSGLVALLISAMPDLRGQVDQIESLIEHSASPLIDQTCALLPSWPVPNNTYGWGRIDGYRAVMSAIPQPIEISNSSFPTVVAPGQAITYTLAITHVATAGLTMPNVVLTDTLPSGTTFLTATGPYTRTNDVIRWEFPSLDPGATRTVQLAVRVDQSAVAVINLDYSVKSAEVPNIPGLPVVTPIEEPVRTFFYFPLIIKGLE